MIIFFQAKLYFLEIFLLHKQYRMLKLFFLFYAYLSFGQTLILSPGEKAWIPWPADQKVRLGDKSLLILKKEKSQISLLAKKPGQTLLTTQDQYYEIFIFDKDNKTKVLQLDSLLKQLWGLRWSLSTDNIFQITGRLYRFSDWLNIMKIAKQYNIPFHFKAKMDEELKSISSYYFNKVLNLKAQANWSELPYVSIPSGALLSNYENLKAFGLIPKEEESWFFKAPLLKIDLAIVETLSSSVFSSGGSLPTALGQFSSIFALLNFLKSSGKGKTLHHSSISAQSGKEILLNSGGQIPFPSYNLKTEQKSTNWKSHGLQIHLTPLVDKKNQIKLKIKARLSEPLSFSSLEQAPPLKSQNLSSEFILDDGQILKIFQLNKKSKGRQYNNQFGFAEAIPRILSGGQNKYKMTQSVFIQAKILKDQTQTKDLHQFCFDSECGRKKTK